MRRSGIEFTTATVRMPGPLESAVSRCRSGRWEQGLKFLKRAVDADEKSVFRHAIALSYYGCGLAKVDRDVDKGLELCREAAKMEFYQPEIQMNLARAHILAGDRKRAVSVLESGLKMCPGHRGLEGLRDELGSRRAPVISFLPRDFFLNKVLGRLRHRLDQRRE